MLPLVSQGDLQPGDLVFFYQPIDHVGIYIGGGLMIDANHTGGFVGIRAVSWSAYAGGARPSHSIPPGMMESASAREAGTRTQGYGGRPRVEEPGE
jgi:cell wall-associated NlpC family hydrolase